MEGPERRTGLESVRGPRVLRIASRAVERVELVGGTRRLDATRGPQGWLIDGMPADTGTGEALDALVDTLTLLRAVDAFRAGDRAALGLDPPQATLVVHTARRERRLLLGVPNASGGALYVAREGHPRVFLVGTALLSAIDRVFYQHDLAEKGA